MSHQWLPSELMYCGNVHPCSTVREMIEQIDQYIIPIKKSRKLESMYLGVWFNCDLLADFYSNPQITEMLFDLMKKSSLIIKSLNAFPQREFHGVSIKENVYFPEWSEQSRLRYTLALAEFISKRRDSFAKSISISTVPLGYKKSWTEQKQRLAVDHLKQLAMSLSSMHKQTGIHIRVCLEMEPDCVLETTTEMIAFLNQTLDYQNNQEINNYIGVCFDVCHQAVMHESVKDSLNRLTREKINIGKIQVSNALRFKSEHFEHVQSILANYINSPYLHQVKLLTNNGVKSIADIDKDLSNHVEFSEEVRIHFHIPINKRELSSTLLTTQHEIIETIDSLSSLAIKPDVEVETYTWRIIDKEVTSNSLSHYLVDEINWLETEMRQYNLIQEYYE